MITQYVETIPEGKTTPDFTRKPIALTIKEGKACTYCKYLLPLIFFFMQ